MVRKTRRHHSSKKSKGVYSIPELRRAFEHIESYIDEKIALKESKEKIVKDLRKEWLKVFFKDLDKKSAESFVSDRFSKKQTRRTIRGVKGVRALQGGSLSGAPLDYTTRPGDYLAPGQIPDSAGHLPFSDGSKSSYGSFTSYVDNGFWNPEPGRSYDRVQGQQDFPTSVPVGMGSNRVQGGGGNRGGSRGITSKRRTRRLPRSKQAAHGGSYSVIQDMKSMLYGKEAGSSPDQVQRSPNYTRV